MWVNSKLVRPACGGDSVGSPSTAANVKEPEPFRPDSSQQNIRPLDEMYGMLNAALGNSMCSWIDW